MNDKARGKDRPATLPFLARSPEPSKEFSILIPPSRETRLVVLELFKPDLADRMPPSGARVPLDSDGTLIITFRSVPRSGLLAGSR